MMQTITLPNANYVPASADENVWSALQDMAAALDALLDAGQEPYVRISPSEGASLHTCQLLSVTYGPCMIELTVRHPGYPRPISIDVETLPAMILAIAGATCRE
jgi:hypothetical protein